MDITRRCNYISNSYYNKGLKYVNESNLTAAAECLKNSLKFNKRNTDARNLLGLIYYRMGEISDALVQWVLSLNLQPYENAADRYLDEVQRTSGLIDSYSKAISGFNQALSQAQGGNDDIALQQLNKITAHYKNYLRPYLLLGLLYLARGENARAFRNFQTVLDIDKGNELALRCVDQLREIQRTSGKKKKRVRSNEPDSPETKANRKELENINFKPYRENTFLSTAANILMGLIIGAASILFVYLPIKEASIARENNSQVVAISEQLNEANKRIKELEEENEKLQNDYDSLTSSREMVNDANDLKLSSFQKLAGAIKAFDAEDIKTCAELFADINPEFIVDVEDGSSASVEHYYDQLKAYFNEIGYKKLIEEGDRLAADGQYEDAIKYYDLSISVHADNTEAEEKKKEAENTLNGVEEIEQ